MMGNNSKDSFFFLWCLLSVSSIFRKFDLVSLTLGESKVSKCKKKKKKTLLNFMLGELEISFRIFPLSVEHCGDCPCECLELQCHK